MTTGPSVPRRGARADVADTYTTYADVADQTSLGSALTFTLASTVDLVFIYCNTATGRASLDGSTPSATRGVVCDAATPTPVPYHLVAGQPIKVFVQSGTIVSVWGLGY